MRVPLNRLHLMALLLFAGCGGATPAPTPSGATPAGATPGAPAPASTAIPATESSPADAPAVTPAPAPLPRISLGGGTSAGTGPSPTASTVGTGAASYTRQEVLAALKPLQILCDEWSAIRQKSVGTQDAGEDFRWIWDHRTQPRQPALVMNSANGKYFRHLRLTYDPSQSIFQLEMTDPEDAVRKFTGEFSEAVQETTSADNKVQRTYKLQFTEIEPRNAKDQWQLVVNQQDNNRYLLEMNRKRSSSFQRFETISAQRKGTSFALSDSDYGDRECVVSGGLGTMQVTFNGKSFWVCCSGCEAAFGDEPARWIAEYEAKQKAAMK